MIERHSTTGPEISPAKLSTFIEMSNTSTFHTYVKWPHH